MTGKERLKANPDLYRVELNAKIGQDVLKGATPPLPGLNRSDSALYYLLSAVEDLAKAGFGKGEACAA